MNKISLDQIAVASPCNVSWDAMHGDAQVRFCGQCERHVYNLSEMAQTEAESLVQSREGKLCVRFYRRADGTMMTQDCPVGWRAVRRRMAWLVAMTAAMLFAVLGLMTLGAWAATRENRGIRAANPVQRVWEWIFPPPVCVMGEPIPAAPPPVVAPPQPQPE